MSKELALSFRLANIKTEEFAIIEDVYVEDEEVRLGTFLDFGTDTEKQILGSTVKFQFDQNKNPFLIISVTCAFEIEKEAWNTLIKEDNTHLTIPEGFASHMAVITVGTARGVLHEKTKNTEFNDFIIPPINLTGMISDDIEIDLENEEL
ncbi:MAG: hypothetical protein RLN83_01090 [Balneola sp.]